MKWVYAMSIVVLATNSGHAQKAGLGHGIPIRISYRVYDFSSEDSYVLDLIVSGSHWEKIFVFPQRERQMEGGTLSGKSPSLFALLTGEDQILERYTFSDSIVYRTPAGEFHLTELRFDEILGEIPRKIIFINLSGEKSLVFQLEQVRVLSSPPTRQPLRSKSTKGEVLK